MSSWNSLPPEITADVLHLLDRQAVNALATVDTNTRNLCLPLIYNNVTLTSSTIAAFLSSVPRSHHNHIHQLTLTLTHPSTPSLTTLLTSTTRLRSLSISFARAPSPTLAKSFENLTSLTHLHIAHTGCLDSHPLSERLVVSIAATIPHLSHLSIRGVSRSSMHRPTGAIPKVTNDDDVPAHPVLGADLALPSLLRLPSLRVLEIGDTPLDDPAWCNPASARIHTLALHPYSPVDESTNATWAREIIGASAFTNLETLVLGVPLEEKPGLSQLTQMIVTPFFPPSSLSLLPPVRTSIECYADDEEDVRYELPTPTPAYVTVMPLSPSLAETSATGCLWTREALKPYFPACYPYSSSSLSPSLSPRSVQQKPRLPFLTLTTTSLPITGDESLDTAYSPSPGSADTLVAEYDYAFNYDDAEWDGAWEGAKKGWY